MKLFEIIERSVLTVLGQQSTHFVGDFSCNGYMLTSLTGSPQSVSGDFYCFNNKLTSLVGAPQLVGGGFDCYRNKIVSFHGVHKIVKRINGDFFCDTANDMLSITLIKGINRLVVVYDERLTKIFNDHLNDIVLLQDALIDAGYEKQARL